MFTPLSQELVPQDIPLEQIYLDPNNPRFTGPDWSYVPDAEIPDELIQNSARNRLVRDFGVNKLRMNMEVNGYLPIDRVIVREFDQGSYVVLEGNRRICAAKMISKYGQDGTEISDEILQSFETIPCLVYTGSDTEAAWIFQGLRHITGISDWSSYNKAKLLVEQMESQDLNLTEVGQRFGLSPHGAGQWVRGYYAYKQAAEESDYNEELDERAYPYFQELFSRSSTAVREWMEWLDKDYKFGNGLNFNEFLSWLYPRTEDEDSPDAPVEMSGDWERRIIRRQDDIRNISYLIRNDSVEFDNFRHHRDLGRAYSSAIQKEYAEEEKKKQDPVEEVFDAIIDCTKALENIPLKAVKDPDSSARLFSMLEPLEKAIELLKE